MPRRRGGSGDEVGELARSIERDERLGRRDLGASRWLSARRPPALGPARVQPGVPPLQHRRVISFAESTLAPALLPIYPAEHVLVAGPARSGSSGLLLATAHVLTTAVSRVDLTVIATRPSPLRHLGGDARVVTDPRELPALLTEIVDPGIRHVALIDDAETLDDATGSIDALLKRLLPDMQVIVAGRADQLRTAYGTGRKSSAAPVRACSSTARRRLRRDLLSVRLPRQAPVPVTAARGWMVHGGDGRSSSRRRLFGNCMPNDRFLPFSVADSASRPAWDTLTAVRLSALAN